MLASNALLLFLLQRFLLMNSISYLCWLEIDMNVIVTGVLQNVCGNETKRSYFGARKHWNPWSVNSYNAFSWTLKNPYIFSMCIDKHIRLAIYVYIYYVHVNLCTQVYLYIVSYVILIAICFKPFFICIFTCKESFQREYFKCRYVWRNAHEDFFFPLRL